MTNNWVCLDIATAPIADAATYLEGTVKAPSNYKSPEAIASYVAEKEAERLAYAACDVDLARVIGVGMLASDFAALAIDTMGTEDDERARLSDLADDLRDTCIVTFGGFNFDLPLLMRRARYLGVPFPALSLDRYRSNHLDLCELLADRNPQRRRSLQFYAKRMGWSDISKPLSGAEEARVPETGEWTKLSDSLRHDVTATYRLALWLGLVTPIRVEEEALF